MLALILQHQVLVLRYRVPREGLPWQGVRGTASPREEEKKKGGESVGKGISACGWL